MTKLLLRLALRRCDDPDAPAARSACGKLAGLVGIFCNVLLFAGKIAAGILAHSVSVVADAVNNLSDASSGIVTLLGFRMAEKPADAEHPYGHARMEYLSGLFVAVMILVIGVELAKASIEKIITPEPTAITVPTLAVLLAAIAVKLWMSLFYRAAGRRINSGTLIACARDSRNDVLATAAVLLGCAIEKWTGFIVDGYFGLGVAAFVLFSGVQSIRQTVDPLLGRSASPELFAALEAEICANRQVRGIHDLMVHDYGPGRQYASVHVEMDMRLSPLACHEIIDEIERNCRSRHGIQLCIHYDPVIVDDPARDALLVRVAELLAELAPGTSLHDFRVMQRASYTQLRFDLVRADAQTLDPAALEAQLAERLSTPKTEYRVAITIDPPGFNRKK